MIKKSSLKKSLLKSNYILKSGFFNNISIIMIGSLLAQIISFGSSPILTRLYSPKEFGIFSIYTSILAILAILSTLRYEYAIILPKHDGDSDKLVKLNILISSVMSLIVFVIILLFNDVFYAAFAIPHSMLYVLPLAMFLTGAYSTFRYLAIRNKKFKIIAVVTIIKSLIVNILQIGFGYIALQAMGLVIGQTISIFVAVLLLMLIMKVKYKKILIGSNKLLDISYIAKEYSQFPRYSAPQGLINSISQAIPAILLVYYFGPIVGGIYALSIKFIQLPVNLLNESFRSVFYQKATELVNKGKPILHLINIITLTFIVISIVPVVFLWLFGPETYSFVLGDKWFDSGLYARWLSIAVLGSMIATPTVVAINIYKIQKFHLYFETSVLLFKLIGLVVSGILYTPIIAVMIYSLISFIMNMILIVYINFYIRKFNRKDNL